MKAAKGSWSRSLEDVVKQTWGNQVFRGRKPLAFAPRKAVNPRSYDKLPVLMLVASEATSDLHRPVFEAVEMLERASGAFKTVVFTETGGANAVKDFDWAVEHCFAEESWGHISDGSWLNMASRRLDWAQEIYGATYLSAARSRQEACQELSTIGHVFDVLEEVVTSAQQHVLVNASISLPDHHSSVRGWVDQLTIGRSQHQILWPSGNSVKLIVDRRWGANATGIVLFLEDDDCELEELVASAGYTAARIQGFSLLASELAAQVLCALYDGLADGSIVFTCHGNSAQLDPRAATPFASGAIRHSTTPGKYLVTSVGGEDFMVEGSRVVYLLDQMAMVERLVGVWA